MEQRSGNFEQNRADPPNLVPAASASGQSGDQEKASSSNSAGNREGSPPGPAGWKRVTGPGWITAIATLLIFVTTATYTYYAKKQWATMQAQLDQMASQLPELQRAANAAEKSAVTAENALKSGDQTTTSTLAQMAIQSKAMRNAAKAMKEQVAGIKDSNRINRDALISVQRAFITVPGLDERLNALDPSETNWMWDVSARIENSGATAAVHVVHNFITAPRIDEPDDDAFVGKNSANDYGETIGPKATGFSARLQVPHFIIKSLSAHRITDKKLFLWGWIIYRDTFEGTPPHLTEFCEQFNRAIHKSAGDLAWTWQTEHCATHNCIDEYCPDYRQIVQAAYPDPSRKSREPN